jgi:assimilatory nitrate reductase electron transfer subunit
VRIVVIGNGMAGSRLVAAVRERTRDVAVTVFGAERWQPYNRLLLSNVLAGTTTADQIRLVDPGWYAHHDVDVRLGVRVTAIDRGRRVVVAADGTETGYDRLVLATGSVPVVPPLPGLEPLPAGTTTFRTVDDCHAMVRAARDARTAVVVGGGLLGVEAARGLAGRGLAVTVVHAAGHLMERQLDAEGGAVLRRVLGRLGVSARVGTTPVRVRLEPPAGAGTRPRLRGVELADGTALDADLLLLACGIRPEVRLAREAGLAIDHGVVVDDRLATVTDPRVFAIGECAQHRGTVYGVVAPAWEQARVVADVLTGADPAAAYLGTRAVTRLKAAGVELAAMGETDLGDDEAEVIRFADPTRGTYQKVVVRDDRLVGAILLGETGTAGTLSQLYDRAAPLPADRLSLLFGDRVSGGPAAEALDPVRSPDSAMVCRCNSVTLGTVRGRWAAGDRTVAEVVSRTRAATGCGSCHADLDRILGRLGEPGAEAQPEAQPEAEAEPAAAPG